MIDRLTEKWVTYTCSEKGETATDKEDVRFLLNTLADQIDRLDSDEAADLYDAIHDDKLSRWLRSK